MPLNEPLSLRLVKDGFGDEHVSVAVAGARTALPEVRAVATGTIPSRAQDPRAPPIESDGRTVREGLDTDLTGCTAES